jgi:hypothetical protein
MNRRAPIRSVLAERRMFAHGGPAYTSAQARSYFGANPYHLADLGLGHAKGIFGNTPPPGAIAANQAARQRLSRVDLLPSDAPVDEGVGPVSPPTEFGPLIDTLVTPSLSQQIGKTAAFGLLNVIAPPLGLIGKGLDIHALKDQLGRTAKIIGKEEPSYLDAFKHSMGKNYFNPEDQALATQMSGLDEHSIKGMPTGLGMGNLAPLSIQQIEEQIEAAKAEVAVEEAAARAEEAAARADALGSRTDLSPSSDPAPGGVAPSAAVPGFGEALGEGSMDYEGEFGFDDPGDPGVGPGAGSDSESYGGGEYAHGGTVMTGLGFRPLHYQNGTGPDPIRSVLAERKMFVNGGLLAMDQGQNKANGILASSESLIDAVVRDAMSPQGGPTMSMDQGGFAATLKKHSPYAPRFSQPINKGGEDLSSPRLPRQGTSNGREMRSYVDIQEIPPGINTQQIPTLTPTRSVGSRGDLEAIYDPENIITMDFGEILRETGTKTAARLYPEYAATTSFWDSADPTASFDKQYPEFKAGAEKGEPPARAYEWAARVLSGGRDVLSGTFGAIAKDVGAVYDFLFSGQAQTQGGVLNARMVAGMIDARPDLEQDTLEMAKTIVGADPEIGPEALRDAIAREVSKKYEVGPNMGYLLAAEDVMDPRETDREAADETVAETVLKQQDESTIPSAGPLGQEVQPPYYGSDLAAPDVRAAPPQYEPMSFEKFVELRRLSEEQGGVPLGGSGGFQSPDRRQWLQRSSDGTAPSPPEVDAVGTSPGEDVGPSEAAPPPPATRDGDILSESSIRKISAGPLGQPEEPSDKEEINKSVESIRNVAKTDDQENVNTSIQTYIDRFKGAIPDYEGKSESEKGWDIVKMGMAIAAGQSPHAITNIAKGVTATIDNFTSDDKERRAYKRQVGLSASKYALDSVARDDAKADALAKEGRSYPWKIVALKDFLDPLTGNQVRKGQVYPATTDQIRGGILQRLPLTFESIYTANAKAVTDVAKRMITASDEARKLNTINWKEANAINERLIKAGESFVQASGGRSLLDGVIKQLALYPDDIAGAKGAANKLWSDVLNLIGVKNKPRAYKTREKLEVDLKMAFQKLIPVALRKIQAGNSISNRDVKNLADAFIAGGFISQNQDGTFTINVELLGKNPELLVYQLQKTNEIFREAQNQALVTFDQELYTISKTEPGGRYDIRYFEPRLRQMGPALERYRARQKSPTPTASSILNVSDYFDLSTGKILKALPRRTQ